MKILLLGLLLFFNIFSESLDEAVFLTEVPEYDRKFIFGNNQIGSSFYGNISYFYFSKPSLLAQRCNVIQYVQQFYDLVFGMSVEDYLLGKLDLRTRIVWGSSEPEQLDERGLNFLGVEYGDHTHGIGIPAKNFFWIREGWVDLDISRFMCLDRSINLVIGTIPYMLGRGISYGVVYAEVPGFIGADSGAVIEEFAPAILLSTEIYSSKNHTLFGDFYCGILTNWSGSYEQNIEPIYEKRIWHCPDESERGFGHINVALIAQLKYEAINKYGKLYVEPYALCNLNPEANIIVNNNNYLYTTSSLSEISSSGVLFKNNFQKLITLGCMVDWQSERFCLNFEFAINKGNLKIYGRDLNNLFVPSPSNDFLPENKEAKLKIFNDQVEEQTSMGIYPAIENDINRSIIESSPKGPEFNLAKISNDPDLFNSPIRFSSPKKFKLEGAMGVLDLAYWLKPDELVFAMTAGFATGGDFNINFRFPLPGITGPEVNLDDEDSSFGAFISLQELYTGLWVQSAFGIGGPFLRKTVTNVFNFNSGDLNLFNKELFNDIKFLGLSVNAFPSYESNLSLNVIYYWSFCTPLIRAPANFLSGFFAGPTDFIELSKNLGLEIFLLARYEFIENLEAYLAWAVFFPGDRFYTDNNPLDFFDFYKIFNCSNSVLKTCDVFADITKFNPVYLFNVGFEYLF